MQSGQRNPRLSKNPNDRVQEGRPEGLRHAMHANPELQQAFHNKPELLNAIAGDPEIERTFLELISDGCAPQVLLWLLNGYVQYDQVLALLRKELDSLKSQFDGLIGGLETVSAKVVSLNEARIDVRSSSLRIWKVVHPELGTRTSEAEFSPSKPMGVNRYVRPRREVLFRASSLTPLFDDERNRSIQLTGQY
jgi:hypothetical protein